MKRLVLVLLLATLVACTAAPRLVVFVVPGPLTHNIDAWVDADHVCVAEPAPLYVTRRCLSMAAVRAFILTAQVADHEAAR
jgi:hypothetical protein